MKNLNELGLQELSNEELLTIEGGNIFKKVINAIVDAAEWVWDCIQNAEAARR